MEKLDELKKLSFQELKRPLTLKMVPNEDGLGPSTALIYVARGLVKLANELGIHINFVVQNGTKLEFNRLAYEALRGENIQFLGPVSEHSVIELIKDGERVVPMATAELLLDYLWKAAAYKKAERQRLLANPIDGVICMGVPVVHSVPKEMGIPVIEVFDHSWPISIARIISDDKEKHPDDWRTKRTTQVLGADKRFEDGSWPRDWMGKTVDEVVTNLIIPAIEEDDRSVDFVFMFPEPLGPGEFWCKWQSFVPGRVSRINGVMGGWNDDSKILIRDQAREKLALKLGWSTSNIKEAKIILVQGGGTPTWDRFLVQMICQCIDWSEYLTNTLFLFTRRSLQSAFDSKYTNKAAMAQRKWEKFSDMETAVKQSQTARLITGSEKEDFADFQMFYLVANLIFSRPGGITVQDAIACRTPIVCAAEPGHWQTEKIRQHCELHEVLRPVKFEAFEAGGIGLVLDQFGQTTQNLRMQEIMRTICNQQENNLAAEILEIIAARIMQKRHQ